MIPVQSLPRNPLLTAAAHAATDTTHMLQQTQHTETLNIIFTKIHRRTRVKQTETSLVSPWPKRVFIREAKRYASGLMSHLRRALTDSLAWPAQTGLRDPGAATKPGHSPVFQEPQGAHHVSILKCTRVTSVGQVPPDPVGFPVMASLARVQASSLPAGPVRPRQREPTGGCPTWNRHNAASARYVRGRKNKHKLHFQRENTHTR